jgi:hypothetical protein
LSGNLVTLLGNLGVKDHLGDARPVPQVDEYQLTVVAPPVYPACQCDFAALQIFI